MLLEICSQIFVRLFVERVATQIFIRFFNGIISRQTNKRDLDYIIKWPFLLAAISGLQHSKKTLLSAYISTHMTISNNFNRILSISIMSYIVLQYLSGILVIRLRSTRRRYSYESASSSKSKCAL